MSVDYTIQHSQAVNEESVASDPYVSSDDEEDDASTTHIPRKEKWWKAHASKDDTPSVTLSKEELQHCLKPDESLPTDEPIWSLHSTNQQKMDNNWAKAISNSFVPLAEDSLLAQTGDMGTFIQWFCKQHGLSELTQKDLEGPAFRIVKAFHSDVVQLQYQMEECHRMFNDKVEDVVARYNVSKPLPLGGTPGKVTIQAEVFFNHDLEYLRSGNKQRTYALSITKMKVALYKDVGLEQLVPDEIWINEECEYDIAAALGISHWWYMK